MRTDVGIDQVLVRFDDEEPRSCGKDGNDSNNGNGSGPNGPTRVATRMMFVSGIHDLSPSGIRYPRFFPL
ncbi:MULTISPECIES: hypothetical protein [unclassified Dyella]|uniref:hypothetical protein n=1 Tax=unclassified Dyella TaxID=2634549 RepID=UPI003F92C471